MSESNDEWLTLGELLSRFPAPGPKKEKTPLLSKRVALMRHSFKDDKEELKGIDPDFDTKGLHGVTRSDDAKLVSLRMRRRLTEAFTSAQSKDRLEVGGELAQVALAFAKTDGRNAEYLGAFRVGEERLDFATWKAQYKDVLRGFPDELRAIAEPEMSLLEGLGLSSLPNPSFTFYDLTPAPEILSGLEGRLIVRWPKGAVNWVRRKGGWSDGADSRFKVVEIRAPGFVMPFPGYDEVDLSWDELRAIVDAKEGNPDWYNRLSAVSGVYLIRDHGSDEGRMYVGSASGSEGIWDRWAGYVSNRPHNGNSGLEKLLKENPGRHKDFRFSILQVMSGSKRPSQVVQVENRWKRKLGSRAHGLNEN